MVRCSPVYGLQISCLTSTWCVNSSRLSRAKNMCTTCWMYDRRKKLVRNSERLYEPAPQLSPRVSFRIGTCSRERANLIQKGFEGRWLTKTLERNEKWAAPAGRKENGRQTEKTANEEDRNCNRGVFGNFSNEPRIFNFIYRLPAKPNLYLYVWPVVRGYAQLSELRNSQLSLLVFTSTAYEERFDRCFNVLESAEGRGARLSFRDVLSNLSVVGESTVWTFWANFEHVLLFRRWCRNFTF